MFKPGDRVVVVDNYKYSVTRGGSVGVVVKLKPYAVYVKFEFTTGDKNASVGREYPISSELLVLEEVYNSPLYKALAELD